MGRQTLDVIEDIKRCISELETEQQMAPINVELVDSNVANIYANSKTAEVGQKQSPFLFFYIGGGVGGWVV